MPLHRCWMAVLALAALAGAGQADWSYFSGTADGNCAGGAKAYPPLELKWRFQAQGGFYFTPAVVDGVVYAGSRDKNVYAIDAATGEPRWVFRTDGEVYGGVTVADGRVFATSADGVLYALDARSGDLLWRYTVGEVMYAPPLCHEGIVCVGSGEGTLLHAVNAEDGTRAWVFGMEARLGSAMAARDGVVYAGSYDHRLYAIDVRTGDSRWSFEGHGYFDSCPLVTADAVYAKTPDDVIYALDRRTGEPLWTYDPWENPEWANQTVNWSPLALAGDDLLLFASNGRYVAALDLETHALRWRRNFVEDIAATPLVAGEVAFLGSKDGSLYGLAVATGRVVWSRTRDEPASADFLRGFMWNPALEEGVLYLASLDGFLEAYRTSPAPDDATRAALQEAPAPQEEPPPANVFGQIEDD